MKNATATTFRQSLHGFARISSKPLAAALLVAVLVTTSGAAKADYPPYPPQGHAYGYHEDRHHNRPHWKRYNTHRAPRVVILRPPVTHYYYEPAPVIITQPPPPPSGLSLIVPLYFR
ncbi:MAG: hypothetical protein ABTQ34_03145 [Bdellovibrionales bacterium]